MNSGSECARHHRTILGLLGRAAIPSEEGFAGASLSASAMLLRAAAIESLTVA